MWVKRGLKNACEFQQQMKRAGRACPFSTVALRLFGSFRIRLGLCLVGLSLGFVRLGIGFCLSLLCLGIGFCFCLVGLGIGFFSFNFSFGSGIAVGSASGLCKGGRG